MSRLKIVDTPIKEVKTPVEEKTKFVLPEVTNQTSVIDTVIILAHKSPSWCPVIANSMSELQNISNCLGQSIQTEGHFFPDKKNLFKAFEKTPLDKVKLVIMGMDPYPTLLPNGQPRAQGSSFSVAIGDEIPGSLKNMFKEIKSNYPQWNPPSHGDLSKWEEQGVFLLNACLTCPPQKSGGHSKYMLWIPFISKVIEAINMVNPNCIYFIWGKDALKLSRFIGDKAHRLIAAHPSPLSAHNGFFGCGHFKKANDILIGYGQTPIEW